MYTLVLAAFLTTGNEVPDFGRRGGCHGCWGGCYGCYGCGGGCYGCYGCGGGCFGCYGCWGGCYGGGCFGCYGCGGGCFGCGGGVMAMSGAGRAGSQGGGGGSGAQGGGGGSAEVTQSLRELKRSVEALKKDQTQIRIDALKIIAEELKRRETDQRIDELRRDVNDMRRRMPPPGGMPPPKGRRELPPPKPGKVLLEMPADAVVIVNERRIDAAASYLTQPLDADKEYVLNIEAAVVRDGKSINRAKRVLIRSGEVVRLAYKDLESTDARWDKASDASSSPAHITVHLPADAQLTVHGVACPLTSDTRAFDTPALPPGQKFYYLLKAEIVRNGRSVAQTRRVDFRSGEQVSVSFDNLGAKLVTAR